VHVSSINARISCNDLLHADDTKQLLTLLALDCELRRLGAHHFGSSSSRNTCVLKFALIAQAGDGATCGEKSFSIREEPIGGDGCCRFRDSYRNSRAFDFLRRAARDGLLWYSSA
jgi:hypothetical protein